METIRHIIELPKDPPNPAKDWGPTLQACIWPLVVLIALVIFRKYVSDIADALIIRIKSGSPLVFGPVSIGEAPKEIKGGGTGLVAVSDPNKAEFLASSKMPDFDAEYKRLDDQDYVLLHASQVIRQRTTPKSGLYRVRVWVEASDDWRLDNIERVTFHVWRDFRQPIISTTSKESSFDLWLNVYGEFSVLARIELKDKSVVTISRYLDLPGRPPD